MPSQGQPEPSKQFGIRVLVPHDRHGAPHSRGSRAVWVWSLLLVAVGLAVAVAIRAGIPWANLTDKLGGL